MVNGKCEMEKGSIPAIADLILKEMVSLRKEVGGRGSEVGSRDSNNQQPTSNFQKYFAPSHYKSWAEAYESIKEKITEASELISQSIIFSSEKAELTKVFVHNEYNPLVIINNLNFIIGSLQILHGSFSRLLVSIAARCLLAIAECTHPSPSPEGIIRRGLLWNEVFDNLFETIGEITYPRESFEQYGVSGIFDECILTAFRELSPLLKRGDTEGLITRLYHVAAHCVLLISYLLISSLTPPAEADKCPSQREGEFNREGI